MDFLSADKDFNMLSLKDLLEARDFYHVHLMHKANVIATALGRYRIRKSEPWPQSSQQLTQISSHSGQKPPRTLGNSEVRPYSWPCILVFVEEWLSLDDFGGSSNQLHADRIVPRAIYLPDGRVVPICVVEAPKVEEAELPEPVNLLKFPTNFIGGGYPIIADVQQQEHIASVGCLLSDGHTVYAMTNRHVSGKAGEAIYSIVAGKKVPIGKSSHKQLTRMPFERVYNGWPGKEIFVNMDIGLIEVEDINQWTAQVYGIGQMGKLADLSINNISLKLIGCPVNGYGSVSGAMAGEIQALFYRYKSVAGFDYVADFLIGSRDDTNTPMTHPGDSGTLWLLETGDQKAGNMPIAVQWGGHEFIDGPTKTKTSYALATCLSTVCNLLDVEIIRDWQIGRDQYWGAVGHYTIGNKACNFIQSPKLKQLMLANLERITFQTDQIRDKNLSGLSKKPFVPLADVPDLVWKMRTHTGRGQAEHPNHFADMDKPGADGKTLLDLCKENTANVMVSVWEKYYAAVGDKSKGLLPFRVWQIYQSMVESVKKGSVAEFVCAAGILSHYVGDACQPLHISHMFDGDPNDQISVDVIDPQTGEVKTVMQNRAKGVHAAYEDKMVNAHVIDIMVGIDARISSGHQGVLKLVQGGQHAAVAVVQLMQKTFDTISPEDIVQTFVKAPSTMWESFGEKTIDVITDGCQFLALLWDSAWAEGGGNHTITKLEAVDTDTLVNLYMDKSFLPSKTLDTIKLAAP